MPKQTLFDPFTTEGLLTLNRLEDIEASIWHGFRLDTNLEDGVFTLDVSSPSKLDTLTPEVLRLALDDSQVVLPSLDYDRGNIATHTEEHKDPKDVTVDDRTSGQYEDVWARPDVQEPDKDNKILSWDHFLHAEHEERPYAYITEAGDLAFDALLQAWLSREPRSETLRYAKPDVLISALVVAGFGRSSAFFQWNETEGAFDRPFNNYTVSGYSESSLRETVDSFIIQGTRVRTVRTFTKFCSRTSPVLVAFAASVSAALSALETHVESVHYRMRTLAQLQDVFAVVSVVVQYLHEIVQTVAASNGEAEILRAVMSWTERVAYSVPVFQHMANEVLVKTSSPLLRNIRENMESKPFAGAVSLNLVAVEAIMPLFLARTVASARTALSLLEGEDSTQFLKDFVAISDDHFKIAFSWDEIAQRQHTVNEYEGKIKAILLSPSEVTSRPSATFILNERNPAIKMGSTDSPFDFRADLFQQGIESDLSPSEAKDDMHAAVQLIFTDDGQCGFSMIACRQAIEYSLTPYIWAQHRLLSYGVLRVLFQQHRLLDHLTVLYRFHLLTDGGFSSRLSMALFDSEQISGEGHRATNATTGLRLQSRQTWPPASSELRLSLMDILAVSMSSIGNSRTAEGPAVSRIHEALSFAIRDLVDDELERCRDVNSIYALDFLRLHYRPSSSILGEIITPPILKKYDNIFMYLLRLLRVKDLAQHMIRRACVRSDKTQKHNTSTSRHHKFLLRIQNFAVCFANYAQNLAISPVYSAFMDQITRTAQNLHQHDYDAVLNQITSLDHLRQLHEDTLDVICAALLLKEEQSDGLKIIEDIFGLILQVAQILLVKADINDHDRGDDDDDDDDDNDDNQQNTDTKLSALSSRFTRQVKNLISLLHQNVDPNLLDASSASPSHWSSPSTNSAPPHKSKSRDKDNLANIDITQNQNRIQNQILAQLLLCLDFNRFYNRSDSL